MIEVKLTLESGITMCAVGHELFQLLHEEMKKAG